MALSEEIEGKGTATCVCSMAAAIINFRLGILPRSPFEVVGGFGGDATTSVPCTGVGKDLVVVASANLSSERVVTTFWSIGCTKLEACEWPRTGLIESFPVIIVLFSFSTRESTGGTLSSCLDIFSLIFKRMVVRSASGSSARGTSTSALTASSRPPLELLDKYSEADEDNAGETDNSGDVSGVEMRDGGSEEYGVVTTDEPPDLNGDLLV